ncbi:ATP-sulfurylase large subunit [Rhodovastum atsumiense]|uniref:Bifunctional enzyme NodQ n=1 Tax=Rhodovastum atsumiense TaxID=504468 RepID=A0A5M6IMJ2_9PROT|nr:GTP-binding protein [Rhodovastum atsumiense]KAA5608775.1 DUF2061 domain-containing protein [Rhodovastum atsumiense]CAH2602873.1 ATP-sulfurylase large subunit [Rhodovastum atsumiense]
MDALPPDAALLEDALPVAGLPARPVSLLRFLTCGSVDDGKSTLIGRLLHDAGLVPSDQMATLEKDSRRWGTTGGDLDFALLVDGLSAEREQGITIDVAYRYFATRRRAFIVADTPGHQQYTRNMATGAAGADLAVILVDARRGIQPQTRRHAFIAGMLRVPHLVLAVNKMDLVGFDEAAFEAIVAEFRRVVAPLGFASVIAIPLCAREGDNLVRPSVRMGWYDGPTLLGYLETIEPTHAEEATLSPRLPVQWVNRRSAGFRGYAGTLVRGSVHPGQRVRVLPGGHAATVARIVGGDGDVADAVAGQAVTLTLQEDIDISRGDVIIGAEDGLRPRRELTARLLWMDDTPLGRGGEYEIRLATATAGARVTVLHHAIDIHSFEQMPADGLEANGIGLVTLKLDRSIAAARYEEDRELGGFILVDRDSNATVALGMVMDDAPAPPLREWHWRSLAKGVTWRITGSIDTFLLSWLITGHLKLAGGIAGAEVFTKIGLFYLHERAWATLSWGKTGGTLLGNFRMLELVTVKMRAISARPGLRPGPSRGQESPAPH